MAPARILFRCDAHAALGGGHVARCLTLADALADRGAQCALAVNAEAADWVPRLTRSRHERRVCNGVEAPAPWAGPADVLVCDHYDFAADEERTLGAGARHLAVIDDLANRAHACALLIDHNAARTPEDYAGLVPEGCITLTGARYALIDPAFAAAGAARTPPTALKRVFVSMGLTDVGAITGRVAHALDRAIARLDHALAVDIAIGPNAASRAQVEALAKARPGWAVHVDAEDLPALMARADLAIGAAGGGALERCAAGLASLIAAVAENQLGLAAALDARGAAMRLPADEGLEAALEGAIAQLSAAPAILRVMSEAARQVCDGQGAARAAEAILALASGDLERARQL